MGSVDIAVETLALAGVKYAPGLSADELRAVEQRFGITFARSQREFLSRVLPVEGPQVTERAAWPDWRHGTTEELMGRLTWPTDGVVFDVLHDAFWPASWGSRPVGKGDAEAVARSRLGDVPALVPLFGHRYFPARPTNEDPPVFSVWQTDVIYYGDDIADWSAREFGGDPHPRTISPDRRTPFWSDLVDGAESEDL
ncbi:hypothetical protein [Phycicoccus flavus]|uniref:hypothetical protein n=1 Tax=Phycicoccus flavus TaxID=2502783 RepID=UPI000FEB92F0|nr:hypothetical protein [Phycicoccus flavus]NHA68643.1 hypothetical protein [Phycicoccus flavus]